MQTEYKDLSYSETLVEIAMTAQRNYDELHNALQDSREITSLVIKWAKEFEKKNENREWDGEWLDEVIDFAERKIKDILEDNIFQKEQDEIAHEKTMDKIRSYNF